jgi:glycosyltransferase involved in cell wall biosynthesis
MVRHGENGFLAETPEQWADAIGRLVNDAELRKRMGSRGRERALAEYGVTTGADQWLTLLQGLRLRKTG